MSQDYKNCPVCTKKRYFSYREKNPDPIIHNGRCELLRKHFDDIPVASISLKYISAHRLKNVNLDKPIEVQVQSPILCDLPMINIRPLGRSCPVQSFQIENIESLCKSYTSIVPIDINKEPLVPTESIEKYWDKQQFPIILDETQFEELQFPDYSIDWKRRSAIFLEDSWDQYSRNIYCTDCHPTMCV